MLPYGASGISTAVLAASVRIPLKIDQSSTGVLPVAISTIMVSPTARPNPIITAEKMPGLAVGNTTRNAVCQRLAPSASEPAARLLGTALMASSAIVKMMGMTAKPMARPTTRLLRWSYVSPSALDSHSRKSPRNSQASTRGPTCRATQPARTSSGTISTNSMPGFNRRTALVGRRFQMSTPAVPNAGSNTIIRRTATTIRSTSGAR